MKIYKVGGAVRDKLLGIPVKDTDWVVVGSNPEEMERKGYRPVGKDFPVFLHPETQEEYALARTERKSGKGYKGFVFHTSEEITLEEDLARRDLTINAMAEDDQGNLIDPFNGASDLKEKILRHVSPAFIEDPLRVLRVARFAARFGFRIAPETMDLMRGITETGELETLTPERIWNEMELALAGSYPTRFILTLRACEALKVLLPEIECLFGIPQPPEYHPEIDTGLHTIMVLNQACRLTDDTRVRFAALMHDLGKGTTPKADWPSHHGHEARGAKLVEKLCKRLKVPNQYRELASLVARYHLDCHRILQARPETLLKKLDALDAFRRPERFEQFLLACMADARGRTGKEDSDYPQADYFRKALAVANSVNTSTFADSGLKGKAIGKAISEARITALKGLTAENL